MALSFSFGEAIKLLQQTGVYDYLLPFILIFALVFAALEKTEVLGSGKTNINALVAFVMGLILIAQQGIVATINMFIPRVSLILVVILMAILVIATIAGKKFAGFKGAWLGLFIILGLAAVGFSLYSGTGTSFISSRDQDTLLIIGLFIAVFGFVIWFVTRSGEPPAAGGGKGVKFLESLADGLRDN